MLPKVRRPQNENLLLPCLSAREFGGCSKWLTRLVGHPDSDKRDFCRGWFPDFKAKHLSDFCCAPSLPSTGNCASLVHSLTDSMHPLIYYWFS